MMTPRSVSGSPGIAPHVNWRLKLRCLRSVSRGSPIRSTRRRPMWRLSGKKSTAVTTKPEKDAAAACSIQSKDLEIVPNIGTIVPGMGTQVISLSKILFGQSRRSILALLYGHADEQFYLREIARRGGTGIGATQRELEQLTGAGLLEKVRRGRQVYYRANRKNPIFAELKSILAKTSGIRDILYEGLTPLEDRIKLAFVY